MAEDVSLNATEVVSQSIKTFSNLLKEFPKSAADDFIYDDSTLEKIASAEEALGGMAAFLKGKTSHLSKEDKAVLKGAHDILSKLMAELPRDAADEFLYDRLIHQQVEGARQAIVTLSDLFR
jgi:hypothetical protein